MSKSTTIQPAPQFAVGELVVITGTGMSWDGQIAAVMSIERVNPLNENDYIVFVERQDEDGRGRGCYLPASQLRPAPQPKSAQPKPAQPDSAPTDPQEKPPKSAPRFECGQRVRIIANWGGSYAAQIGVVGVIERKRQYRRWGYHTYDVGYQDERGRDKIITAVREDDLMAVSPVADWLDDEPEPEPEPTPPVKPAPPTKPAKAPEPLPPLFAKGEHVTVDPRSELAYETFTRKGSIGVIMRADNAVRGIRRYQVLFEDPQTGGRRATRIREEHLVKAELPAPREYATVRHAYEYRDQHPRETHLWCDAAGCFEEACAVCQQHSVPTLFQAQPTTQPTSITASQMPYSTAALTALGAEDTYEFAVTLVREKLEHDEGRDAVLAWQVGRQLIALPGGSTCYDVTRGGFYVTMNRGRRCSLRYALKALVAEAERRIAGVPRQVGLWGSAVRA